MPLAPVTKYQILDVDIIDLLHDGGGVAKVENFPVFVKNALPGENVKIKITEVKKSFALGYVLKFNQTSPFRVAPKCKIYDKCGGCNIQHLEYSEQLREKTNLVKETLSRIGKLDVKVNDCLGMEKPWKYRNKTQVPFGLRNEKVIAGFFKDNTHEIIDMNECDIQDKVADAIINYMKELCGKYGLVPYDETTHSGNLRHVVIRKAYATGEFMVTLVTKEHDINNRDKIIKDLINKFPMIKSIIQNINPHKTNTILGDSQKVLYGDEYLIDCIGDVKYAIRSRSFYQVNPVQTKVLYDLVVEYAGLTGTETLIDAYCGIGTIGLYLSKKAGKIYGVEIVPDAILDAKLNAELNNFTNAYYEAGKAEEIIKKWQEQNITADVIVVDPPRKGCETVLLDTIKKMAIPRMIYVSCDPATLARDLAILSDKYEIVKVQPVDMFPHTMHVECVVLMSRVKE